MKAKQYEILELTLKNWKMTFKMLQHPYLAYFFLRFALHPILFKKETKLNQLKRYGLLNLGGGLLTPKELKAAQYGLKPMMESIEGALYAAKNNKPVIWFDWAAPTAIMRAFDVEMIVPSIFNMLANYLGTDGSAYYAEAAEKEGISPDMCSGNKIAIGAYFLNQLPKPSAVVGAAHPCDSGRSQNQLFGYFEDAPSFMVDTIYGRDEEAIEKNTQSTWALIRFLEKTMEKEIDWDKLKNIALEMNRFNHFFNEIMEMHRIIPSPRLLIAVPRIFKMRQNVVGSPDATKMMEELYNIAKKRVAKNNNNMAKKENIRVIMVMPPMAFTELYMWMEKEFGAVVVSDYIGGSGYPEIDTSTEESIVRGITLENLHLGMTRQTHGPIEFTTEELERILEDYSGDCLIYNSHIACKQNLAADKIIKDICKKSKLPVLFLEVDIFDKRIATEEYIKRQIKDFFITNNLI